VTERAIQSSACCLQELKKLHEFEDQFQSAAEAQAAKYNLPAVTLDDLPATFDLADEHAISAKEVKWIIQKAKDDAAKFKQSEPRFADPYSTPDFQAAQEEVAERFGIPEAQLAELQKGMTPSVWKQIAAKQGVAIAS
jgi:hypothetical protein